MCDCALPLSDINVDMYVYVCGFEKKDHFGLIIDFDLVVLCKSTVGSSLLDFVALRWLLPFPRYAHSKYENTLSPYLRSLCVFAHSDTS